MKNIKKMGSVLIINFYTQTYVCIYIYIYMKALCSAYGFFFFSEVRHHLLEIILTLKTYLWENKASF